MMMGGGFGKMIEVLHRGEEMGGFFLWVRRAGSLLNRFWEVFMM